MANEDVDLIDEGADHVAAKVLPQDVFYEITKRPEGLLLRKRSISMTAACTGTGGRTSSSQSNR
jgi:hypothetical protein